MKRFLFLAVLMSMFAIGNVSAQVISYSQTKVTKLEKERKPVELRQFAGVELGLYPNSEADIMLGAFYEAGVMLNRSIFVGGGLGIGNVFNQYAYHYGGVYYHDMYDFTAKIYADAKFYITKTKFRPYFDLALGGVLYTGTAGDQIDMIVNPQFGLCYNIGRRVNSVFVSVGYSISNIANSYYDENSYSFKLGISF